MCETVQSGSQREEDDRLTAAVTTAGVVQWKRYKKGHETTVDKIAKNKMGWIIVQTECN